LGLDTQFPHVEAAFRRATDSQRKAAVVVACEIAVRSAGVVDESISQALAALHAGVEAPFLIEKVSRLSEEHDEEYFRLSNNTEMHTPESAVFFRKSRAASAVALALSGELNHALYEAWYAVEDDSELPGAIEEKLIS
jgi:hypothetical protein